MKHRTCALAFLAVLATAATPALAAPTAILAADFDGSETVIDFNTIGDEVAVTNQYAASGITFGGALFGMTNSGDTNLFNGSTIASNWRYNGSGLQGLSWTASFSSVITMVGFLAETNLDDDVTIEAFMGANSLGTLSFANPNGIQPDFLGIRDLGGFDRITVTTGSRDNGFFAMDNLRFGGRATAVPEPMSLALVGLGLLGAGLARRRPSC